VLFEKGFIAAFGKPEKAAMPNVISPELSTDLLRGLRAVAAFIGESENVTYWLIRTKRLPAGKLGGKIIASKTQLTRHIDALLQQPADRPRIGRDAA
jgi:hypothetical protein